MGEGSSAAPRKILNMLVSLLGLAAVIAGLHNVYSDNAEVERMAAEQACADRDPSCRAAMTRHERAAWGQTFAMSTTAGTVDVKCRRQFYLVGDYHCERQGSGDVARDRTTPAGPPHGSAGAPRSASSAAGSAPHGVGTTSAAAPTASSAIPGRAR